jgi:hypothetical protein
MKNVAASIVIAVLLCLSVAATALAEKGRDRRKMITLSEDAMVNDKLLKKGTYEIRFDAETSQVLVLKDSEVIATAKAEVQMLSDKARYNQASFVQNEKGRVLNALRFAGDRREILLTDGSSRPAE